MTMATNFRNNGTLNGHNGQRAASGAAEVSLGVSLLLQAALEYLRRGWGVIPLRPADKRPLFKWLDYQRRLATPTEVRAWWENNPQANIGIVTGTVSGLMALDVDGPAGRHSLEGKLTPLTITNQTSHGWHYLYRHPGVSVKNKVALSPGLDIRGDGGYIVAPPSLHPSGTRYSWAPGLSPLEAPLAPAPLWLLDLLGPNPPAATPTLAMVQRNGEAHYENLLRGVGEGSRNDTAARLAGHLLAKGLPKEEVRALLDAWNRNNVPPLPALELIAVVDSIAAAAMKNAPAITGPFCVPVGKLLKKRIPKPDWLVESLLEKDAIGYIGGEPKLGKSWLALHLAVSLTTATPFLGHFPVPRKRRVLYLQEEDGLPLVQQRLRHLLRGIGKDSISDKQLHCSVRSGFRIDNEIWRGRLEEELAAFKPELVIVDVFNKIHGKDENSQPEMTQVMSAFEDFRRRFSCGFMIVHHFRKSGGIGVSRRGNQNLRGSSVLGGWSESSLYITGRNRGHYRVAPESKASVPVPFIFAFEEVRNRSRTPGSRLSYQGEAPQRRSTDAPPALNVLMSRPRSSKKLTRDWPIGVTSELARKRRRRDGALGWRGRPQRRHRHNEPGEQAGGRGGCFHRPGAGTPSGRSPWKATSR